jgi:hypothetical protein
MRDREAFGLVLRRLLPKPLIQPVSIVIPIAEITVAGFLLSRIAPRLALVSAITLLLVFSLILAEMLRRGVKGCGCFGENEETATPGSGLVRNFILIAAALSALNQPLPFLIFGPDASSSVGRVTIVAGTLCLWPCLVTLVHRRKFLFN